MEILSLLASLKTVLISAGLGLVALLGWWQSRRNKGRNTTINRQEAALEIYQAKGEIAAQDRYLDAEKEKKINALDEKTYKHSPEEAAVAVSGALNDFFNPGADGLRNPEVSPVGRKDGDRSGH